MTVKRKPWRPPPRKPYKPREAAVTSRMMARVRARDTKAELALRRAVWRRGLRYRLYAKDLPGRPDMVFRRARVVVFVDGDFWHARTLLEEGEAALRESIRGERQEWWVAKLKRNAERDREVNEQLRAAGWHVLRLWESDVKADVEAAAEKVVRVVRRRERA